MALIEADIRHIIEAMQSIAKSLEKARASIDTCAAEIRSLVELARARQAGQHDLFSGCGCGRDMTEGPGSAGEGG